MSDRTEIEQILNNARRNPADTVEFLLGTICNDVRTIKERQADIIDDQASFKVEVRKDIQELKRKNAFNKGFIAALTAVGGALGYAIGFLIKFLFAGLH